MTTTSRNVSADFQGRPLGERGNILIYVLMTMVIFAVIGVTMVSLFSTSISSSATANETRRAFYLSESGIRYAMSELRQSSFSRERGQPAQHHRLQRAPSGSFGINVFGAWFKSPSNQNVASGRLRSNSEGGKVAPDFFDTQTAERASSIPISTSSSTAIRAEAERQRDCQGDGVLCHGRKLHVVSV